MRCARCKHVLIGVPGCAVLERCWSSVDWHAGGESRAGGNLWRVVVAVKVIVPLVHVVSESRAGGNLWRVLVAVKVIVPLVPRSLFASTSKWCCND